ncbi:MAG: hypothetical protein HRF43_02100 [Phycisphaerae bacterium]
MPSFFSRRYMRGAPRLTERLVGAFILLLTAFIVGTFLLTGGLLSGLVNRSAALTALRRSFGLSERPLFVAAAENLKPPAPPHELRAAEAMLPPAPEGWKRTELRIVEPEQPGEVAATQGSPAAALEATFKAYAPFNFGLERYYRAVYEKGSYRMVVQMADMGTPEAAFGLWRMLRERDATALPLGRGGWLSTGSNAAAFWAGRYFTAVLGYFPYDGPPASLAGAKADPTAVDGPAAGAPAPQTAASVEQMARAAAALQINYGGPFWAESVLPYDGRVADSLLYVRRNGLGLAELSDCWSAAYTSGATLAVTRPPDPRKVLSALRSRFEKTAGPAAGPPQSAGPAARLASDQGVDEYAETPATQPSASPAPAAALPSDLKAALGADAAAGRVHDRLLVACLAGPYVFVAAGPSPEPLVALARTARARAVSSPAVETPADTVAAITPRTGSPAAGQARFAEVEGGDVQAPTRIERFTDNLYEKIDGREGQFRAFGFVELRFGQYLDARRRQTYDVYLYDMGRPDNALGIYAAEKSGETDAVRIGAEGYISGANVYFRKNRYYVNVLGPAEGGPAAAETARRIAAAIADTIADSGGGLWADELLPRENRQGPVRFQATSALSQEFLERFFFARYEVEGTTFDLFIHKAPDAGQAAELFRKYAVEIARFETVVSREKTDGGETLVSESLGIFTVVFHKGPYFAGVSNLKKNRELAVRQAAALRDRLNAADPGEPAPPRPDSAGSSEGGDHGY